MTTVHCDDPAQLWLLGYSQKTGKANRPYYGDVVRQRCAVDRWYQRPTMTPDLNPNRGRRSNGIRGQRERRGGYGTISNQFLFKPYTMHL